MVLTVVLATTAAAAFMALGQVELFRAGATVTVPQPRSAEGESSDQYLASQVLLMQSPEVADRAVMIANRALGEQVLIRGDFKGEGASLLITPPEMAAPGTYGANVVTVAFTSADPEVAKVGVNSLLRAFDDVRSDRITAQGQATVAGVERAIKDARTEGQRKDLLDQRTKALVDQETDLARHPTFAWATEPRSAVNGNVKRSGLVGLLVGAVLGAALAFARASRRRTFDDQFQPEALYGAPLLGELPEPGAPGRLTMASTPCSAAAEAFRFTAGSLQRIRAERGKRLSLVFVSPKEDAARSAVVANLALAIAESGTRVLAVDAGAPRGDLSAWLLPDRPKVRDLTDGLEQVLAGEMALPDCIRRSPLHDRLAVLPSSRTTAPTVTGAAYLTAVRRVLGKGKAGYEIVLVDSPALLQAAVATDLVDASDAVVVVMGPHEPIRAHVDLQGRLDLIETSVVGYIYRQESTHRRFGRLRQLLAGPAARLHRARVRMGRPLAPLLGTRR
jgi:Mrp family chromosome partitioning ATPase